MKNQFEEDEYFNARRMFYWNGLNMVNFEATVFIYWYATFLYKDNLKGDSVMINLYDREEKKII